MLCTRRMIFFIFLFFRLEVIHHLFYDDVCGSSPSSAATSHDDNIRSVLPDVRAVMRDFNITYIHAGYQIDEVLHATNIITNYNEDAVARILKYHQKVLEFVPAFFVPLTDDLKQCIQYMKRYLLSFYQGKKESSSYVETAFHYEMKRREIERVINMHMKNITNMGTAYRSKRGLNVKMFGFSTNELARRCDVGDLPMLLVFPEACANIQHACAAVEKWVKADQEYAEFLKMDIMDLESKKDRQLRIVRDGKQTLYQTEHRIKNIAKEIQDLEQDIARLKHRDKQLSNEIDKLKKSKHNMNLDIEIKEQQREEIRAQTPINYDKINTIADQIATLRSQLPDMDRKIDYVRNKMALLTDRKQSMESKEKELSDKKKEVKQQRKTAEESEAELKRIDEAIAQLKEIYSRKTSNDVTKKIFHDLPVEPRNARLLPNAQKPEQHHQTTKTKKHTTVKGKFHHDYKTI